MIQTKQGCLDVGDGQLYYEIAGEGIILTQLVSRQVRIGPRQAILLIADETGRVLALGSVAPEDDLLRVDHLSRLRRRGCRLHDKRAVACVGNGAGKLEIAVPVAGNDLDVRRRFGVQVGKLQQGISGLALRQVGIATVI